MTDTTHRPPVCHVTRPHDGDLATPDTLSRSVRVLAAVLLAVAAPLLDSVPDAVTVAAVHVETGHGVWAVWAALLVSALTGGRA